MRSIQPQQPSKRHAIASGYEPMTIILLKHLVHLNCTGGPPATETHKDSGITEQFFFSYFSGLEQACAIELGNVRLFDNPLLLSEYNPDLTHAPQSFVYVE